MKARIAVLVCAGLLLGGCADHSPAAGPAAAPSATATPEQSRAAQVYAAVIRKLVLGANGSAPDATPYKRIWVVDHEVVNAGQPDGQDQAGAAFSDALKADLKQALADLPPLAFISDPDTALTPDYAAADPLRGQIRGHGTVILLSPIETHGDRLHVGHELWCAAHCAEWFTSVLQKQDDAWVVTGETGPHAIT
jgi:hypothetical protein